MSGLLSDNPRRALNVRQAETVERLLEAAGALLEEQGHEQMTIRTVASRAGVSAATAYNYFSSKDHLFAQLFWRLLASSPGPALSGTSAEARVRQVTTQLAQVIAGAPALAAAANKSLLGSDPEVHRLRISIGAIWIERFREAIGEDASPDLLEALSCAFVGALLQAGIGVSDYAQLPDVLSRVVGVIMRGSPGAGP